MELQRRLVIALLALLAVVVVATCGYKFLGQNVTWLDAVYMTVVTLATVGYGEIVDTSHSAALRAFNLLVLTFGIGLMLYVFSVATAFVVEGELKNLFWRRRMEKRIAALTGHVIVCAADDSANTIVDELVRSRRPVVIVEQDAARMTRYQDVPAVSLVEGDPTDEEVLGRAGLDRAAGVVAALPSDKDNLVITITVRDGGLTVAGGGPSAPLTHLGEMRFWSGVAGEYRFERVSEHWRVVQFAEGWRRYEPFQRINAALVRAEDYRGRYRSPELDVVATVEGDSGVSIRPPLAEPIRLTPIYRDGFAAPGRTIRFMRDAGGRVTGFRIFAGRVRDLRFERIE